MLELTQELSFVDDALHTFLLDNLAFGHFLHCIYSFELSSLDLPDLSEPTLADDAVELEVVLVDGLTLLHWIKL